MMNASPSLLFALLWWVIAPPCTELFVVAWITRITPRRAPLKILTPGMFQAAIEPLVQGDNFILRTLENHSPPGALENSTEYAFQRKLTSLTDHDFSTPMPLSLLQGEAEIKQALVLAACNPRIGGVVIWGSRGSGKSTLAKALSRLLPTHMERVKDSRYNVDPHDEQSMDSLLQASLQESGKSLQDLETEFIPTPYVTVPLNVMEDSLLGTVDLEASLESGITVFSPGLLARAHRGILHIDDINLLEESTLYTLFQVLADGRVRVEREGMSVEYPCQPLLVATYNPEEGEVSPHLLDRIAIALPTQTETMSAQQRVEAVLNVEGYREKTLQLDDCLAEERALRDQIEKARQLLPQVHLSHDQQLYLCQEATRADCEGQRGEIFACEIAKTRAALNGRTKVQAGDLQLGVLLAIVPRSRAQQPEEEESTTPDDLPHSQQIQDQQQQGSQAEPPDQEALEEFLEQQQQHQQDPSNEPPPEVTDEEEELEIPLQFMFGVDSTEINPKVLRFQKKGRKGKGGKASNLFNLKRGRFVKAIFPQAGDWKRGRIAVGATLRAAAPHQKIRHTYSIDKDNHVYIRPADFRIKRMKRKAGCLVIFVVDASGSMALNRMGAAKGAAMSLLKEAYKSRDKISLISFHGHRSEVNVPPTKSMALTRSRLEEMPCGGGSPLAHALTTAIRTGMNEIKVKKDVGRAVVVLLTDGRANIPLSVSEGEIDAYSPEMPSRAYMKEEAIAVAKTLGSLQDFDIVVVDTEDKFVGTGIARDIAKASQGLYQALLHSDAASVSNLAREAVESSRVPSK